MDKKYRAALCALLLIGTLACKHFLPTGALGLRTLLFGHADNPVSAACSAFVQTIKNGQGLTEGVLAFCDGLVRNADEV